MASTPATSLLQTLERTLASVGDSGGKLAVGYSGGRDSTVLLALCCRLRPGMVTALYVDHGWRSAEERSVERALVQRVTERLSCTLQIFEAPSGETHETGSREALAREHRYGCFGLYLLDHQTENLLLAHHAQDQAETILMRLLQGRSWQGLSGIPKHRGAYLRPFLEVWPQEIEAAALELQLEISHDSTNWEDGPLRNALRNRVFPLLESVVPGASRSLVRFGEVWSELQPGTVIDPRWDISDQRATLERRIWETWTRLDQGNQLQSLASLWNPGRRPRRFVDSLLSGGEAGGLRLKLEKSIVVWEAVVKLPGLQYFRETAEGQPVDLGFGQVSWSFRAGDDLLDGGTGPVRPPVFLASHEVGAVRRWKGIYGDVLNAEDRRSLEDAVFWLLGTEVRGVFDPMGWRWLWKPEPAFGAQRVWVTLRRRAYER